MKEDIIVAVVSVLASGLVTYIITCIQFANSRKEKVTDQQRKLYAECYHLIEKALINHLVVFEKNYFDELVDIKERMKLEASNAVLQAFKKYYLWVAERYKSYLEYDKSMDPREKANAFITITNDETSAEGEMPTFSTQEFELYLQKIERYPVEHEPQHKTIKSKAQDVLNSMRKDLGNDEYYDDIW